MAPLKLSSAALDRHRQAIRPAAEGVWAHAEIARRCITGGEPHVAVHAILIRAEWESALDLAIAEYLRALGAS